MPPESDQVLAARDQAAASKPPVFRVRPERVNVVYRLRVGGELDLATRTTLREELRRAEASDAKRIELDLRHLTFIDSTGIAVLIEAHKRSANGRRLRVSFVGGQVREVLEMTGLTKVLDFAE
jgi:anti-anti-sigma factor